MKAMLEEYGWIILVITIGLILIAGIPQISDNANTHEKNKMEQMYQVSNEEFE